MNKNIKRIFFVTMLLVLLLGVGTLSASDVSNDTTTMDDTNDITITPVQSDTPVKSVDTATSKNIKKEETTTDLYVSDTDGSDDNNGTNTSPYKTIQKALDNTNSDSTFNIHIAEGTYKGLGNTNLTVNGNYNINFIGEGINKTIFDGEAKYTITTEPGYVWESTEIWWPYVNESGNYGMTITGSEGIIKITNLTVQNMYCPGGSSIDAYPHATIDNYGNLEVDCVAFYSNHAGVGSAIRNNNGGTLLVNNSFFENNTKSSSTGNDGIIYTNGTATILNSLFNHNYARWGSILNDKNLTVINTTFTNGISYDGNSAYKYGTGIAFNTGGADFYRPGFFLTYNTVLNCTFISNQQADLYGYAGNLLARGNKFINSTGIRITDIDTTHTLSYLIDENIFENMLPSSISQTLSTPATTFAIRTSVEQSNITISNNNFTSENATMIYTNNAVITNNNIHFTNNGVAIQLTNNDSIVENNTMNGNISISGNKNTVKNNKINATSLFAIYIPSSGRNNTVINNELYANPRVGQYAVSNSGRLNIIENNTPIIPDNYIFVDPTNQNVRAGTMNLTTTMADALKKVQNNGTIYLIPSTSSSTFSITSPISINTNTVKAGTTEFNIKGFTDNITMDGKSRSRIFNISEGFTINISNINFQNTNSSLGGTIYSEGNLNIANSTFTNSRAEYGGAIYSDNESNITLTNNVFNNIQSNNETLYLNNTGNKNINNNTYKNASVNYELNITSNASTTLSHINETIIININEIVLANPTFYDSNILENINFNIYQDNQMTNITNTNTYSIDVTSPESITTYVIPDKFNKASNILEFEIEYTAPININIYTPDVIAFTTTNSSFETILLDEFNNSVESGIITYYYNEELIGSAEVINSKATLETPILDDGMYNITVKYEDPSGKYSSNINTTMLYITDALYVSLDVTTPQSGIKTNPTTIKDALTKVLDNQKIILLKGNDEIYKIDETITINKTTVPKDTTIFTIEGENITLDGQNKTKIMLIRNGFTITIQNITFINGYDVRGSAIEVYSNLTLNNTNFYNNFGSNAGAIDGSTFGEGNLTIVGTNSFINNTGYSGAAIDVYHLNMSGNNLFENNNNVTIRSSKTLIMNGNNTFKNNKNGVISIYGSATIEGISNFINNSGITYNIISVYNYTNISGARFINNTITSSNIHIIANNQYIIQTLNLNIINNEFINNSLNDSNIICSYRTGNYHNIINNTFINNSASNEILTFTSNATLINNTYINSTIGLSNFKINLSTPIERSLQVNETIPIQISSFTLKNPNYYDESLQDYSRLKYNVFTNKQLTNTTDCNISEFNYTFTEKGDMIIYITPAFSQYKSNELIFDVEYENLKNTVITTNNTFTTVNESTNVIVEVKDKQNNPVTTGIVNIYDEENNLLGISEVTEGIANVSITNFNTIGVKNIIVEYLSNTTYNNQTNTSKIIITSDDIYVSFDVSTPQSGIQDNPTTLLDAFSKINNGGTIHIVESTTNTLFINETININSTLTQEGITSFNISSDSNNITFDAQQNIGFYISKEMTIQFNNLKFINATETISNNGTLIINGRNIFDNLKGGRAINNNGTLTINGSNIFKNCGSGNGGAIYTNGTLIIIGENIFANNTVDTMAQQTGGGVINSMGGILLIEGNNKFNNNQVRGASQAQGGAIRALNTNITINGENIFEENKLYATSTSYGGTIYTSGGKLIINGSNIFTNSYIEVVSGASGGTIYSTNTIITINGSNIFNGSTVNGMGGTIFSTGSLSIEGNNIFNNSLGTNGGILSISYNTNNNITGNNIFTNSKGISGAAIYMNGYSYYTSYLTIDGATFKNITNTNGGAINLNYINTILTNNTFIDITSEYETLNLNNSNIIALNNNKYQNCTIAFNQFTTTSPQENQDILIDAPITINNNIILTNPTYYDANILENTEYQIFINDENKYNTTASEYTFTPEEYGKLNIYAYSPLINAYSNNITININKYDITIDPITASIGDIINITATITLNDETMNNLNTGKVTFKVNGKTLKDANGKVIYAKVVNGTATIENYAVPQDWTKEGTTIQAVYSGSTQLEKLTSEKTNLTVAKAVPTLTTESINTTAGQTITLTATITDNDKEINTGKIVFKINGKTVKDANGKVIYAKIVNNTVSVDYTIPESMKTGNYTITAVYVGSDYDKLEASETLTITA